MEEDRPNEYEEMMRSDEDFEEDVVEEEADPLEKNIDEDIKKVGTIKSEEDIKEEDVEIEEKEEVKEEPEEEVIVEEDPIIEETPEKEELELESEPTPEPKVEEEPVVIPVKKTRKPIIVAKRSRIRKALVKKKVVAKIIAKRQPTKKRKTSLFPIAYSIIGIVIIILAIFLLTKTTIPTITAAAVVNGYEISVNDLEKEYAFFFLIGGLPEEYKQEITKEFFLNSTLIPEKLVLAEAEKNNIQVTEEEVNAFVQNSIEQAGSTMESFESTISNLGLTLDDIKGYFKKQLISFKLLNATVLGYIEISDEEIELAYNSNKDIFDAQNQSLDGIKEDLRKALLLQKQRTAAQLYMAQLVQNADIQIYYPDLTPATTSAVEDFTLLEEEVVVEDTFVEKVVLPEVTADITTFSETNDELCEEDGKPIVRMYSTSWCPHCNWVKETFDNVAQEYADLGKITISHWQLDTGDDELTSETEASVPREEIELFQKYNPDGYVPVFVFGCKYYRIGNGYESENNLAAEEAEFRAVIHSLI